MINLFTHGRHAYTVTPFLKDWPNRASSCMRLVSYQKLHRINAVRGGVFVFSDIDRLTLPQKAMAEQLCLQIRDCFRESVIVNHPGRVPGRYDLLMRLWRDGINRFRVFRYDEWSSGMRYPVFLRRADDHKGSLTGLLCCREELKRRLRVLKWMGVKMNELIAVEFCDTRGSDNFYRKYAAFRIGERVVPGHIIFSRHWVVKDSPPEPIRQEEKSYLEENPHGEELMAIFRAANIEYGRIDYAMQDGRIQVWEINTNPMLIQKKMKYAADKIPYKIKLVDRLSESFMNLRATSISVQLPVEKRPVNLCPPLGLKLNQILAKKLNPVSLL